MILKYSILSVVVMCGGALGSVAQAQSEDHAQWKDYSYVKQSEAWFGSENAAGLSRLSIDRISLAEVFFNKQNGELINYYQSDNCYTWGAETESFYRLNPKVVFYGKVGYTNFTGKHMAGSAFINPEEAPFDLVEYTEDNKGEKNLETYHIVGAVSGELSRRWTLGAKFDFMAANYAKDKDLRHKNSLLDMYLTVGATYKVDSDWEIGANYYYRRGVEGLDFDTYGTSDATYTTFIDYGAFYGRTEAHGAEGFTRDNYERPLVNEYHGVSLQFSWQYSPKLSWYNELTYKVRDGYYGKKSPYTAILTEHDSDIFGYTTTLSLKEGKNRHDVSLNARSEDLNNFIRVYQTETGSDGVSDVVYYGKLKVCDKVTWNIGANYVGYFGISDYLCPVWVVKGGINHTVRDIRASVYPYYRVQELGITDCHVSAERNIIVKQKNLFNVMLGLGYHTGSGDVAQDATYVETSESQVAPASHDTYLYKEYEYLTANQLKGDVGFKYARMFDKQNIQCHVSLNYGVRKAFDTDYLGNGIRHEVHLAIGCTF